MQTAQLGVRNSQLSNLELGFNSNQPTPTFTAYLGINLSFERNILPGMGAIDETQGSPLTSRQSVAVP